MAWTEQCNKIYWIHHFTAGDKICQKYCNTICTCHYLLLERPLPAISCQCKLQYCFCPFLCECPTLFLLAGLHISFPIVLVDKMSSSCVFCAVEANMAPHQHKNGVIRWHHPEGWDFWQNLCLSIPYHLLLGDNTSSRHHHLIFNMWNLKTSAKIEIITIQILIYDKKAISAISYRLPILLGDEIYNLYLKI